MVRLCPSRRTLVLVSRLLLSSLLGLLAGTPALMAQTPVLEIVDEAGNLTAEVLEGDFLRLRLLSPADNYSSDDPQTVFVTVEAFYSGEFEDVPLVETGLDTSVFEGRIRLSLEPTGTLDGRLWTSHSGSPDFLPETLTATYSGQMATATTVPALVRLIDAYGRETATYAVGESVRVRLVDHGRNDPFAVDAVLVQVTASDTGDVETVELTETDFDTATFEGSVPLDNDGPQSENGSLQALVGAVLTAAYEPSTVPGTLTAQADLVTAALVFVDGAGQPAASYLEGSRLFLRVVDAFADQDSQIAELVEVTVSSDLAGDVESVFLAETGLATGIFEGALDLQLGFANSLDGTLQTSQDPGPPHAFDTLRAVYQDSGLDLLEVTAQTAGSRIAFIDAYGRETSSYAAGTTAYVRVEDHNANQPGVFDMVEVSVVSSSSGDFESYALWEVDKNSAVFEGAIPLAQGVSAQGGDGVVQAEAGETLEAEHVNALGLSSVTVRADLTFAQLFFIDAAGRPTAQLLEAALARVRLLNPPGNQDPGTVEGLSVEVQSFYGFDVEAIFAEETGPDTGVFEGGVILTYDPTNSFDGRLSISFGGYPQFLPEQVTATFVDAVATATTVGSQGFFLDAYGRTTATYAVGETIRLRVVDHNRNDPLQVDAFLVQVSSAAGDVETVELTETGHDTAVFEGAVASVAGPVSPEDGTLQAEASDLLELVHENVNSPLPTTAEARMVRVAVLFVDAAGQPATSYLESTRLTLRIVDSQANTDGGVAELTYVNVSSELAGDGEALALLETGADTGVFEGSLNLALGTAVFNDAILQTTQAAGPPHEFDTLKATYYDPNFSELFEATARTEGSRIAFVDAFGTVTSSFAAGSTAYLRVEDHNANQPGVFDTVEVAVVSLSTGDFESLSLQEVDPDSGLFEGFVALEAGSAAQPSDGMLQAEPGEVIEAEHVNALGLSTVRVQATLSFAGLLFVDAAGQPVVELAEGGPARLRLIAPARNNDPGSVEVETVEVTSFYGGDVETVTVEETGADTGVFEGTLQLTTSFSSTFDGPLFTTTSGSPLFLEDTVTASFVDAVATARTVGSAAHFLDAFGRLASTYALGERLYLRVVDHGRNDYLLVDALLVQLTSAAGDVETVELTETSFDSATFEGSIPSRYGPFTVEDGVLGADLGDLITLIHENVNTPQPTTAAATMAGAAIRFLDEEGQPAASYLEGTRVHVQMVYTFANTNSSAIDFLSVELAADLSFDAESLELTETAPDSGVFEGSMNLSLGGAASFNNTLETTQDPGPPHRFDTLRATYFEDFSGQLLEATARTEGSRIVFLDAYGRETGTFAAGSTAYLRVVDHNANHFGVFDTVEVAVVSLATGDFESFALLEVDKNSAVFEGAIPLVSSATAQISDGALQAEPGEVIEAEHVNALGLSTVRVQATLSFSQLLFVDTAGQPVAEIAEGGPARLRLIAPARNNDPGAVEVETVEVTSFYGGDVEPLTVEETGADTGVFEGTIQLTTSFSASFDGQLFTSTSGSPLFLQDTVTANFVDAVATAKTVGSEVAFLDAFGRLTDTYAVGERVYLRVVDHNRNDEFQVDSFQLQVTSSSGDTETVEVTETSHDTAVFEGSIASSGVGLNPQDGQLQAAVGDDLVLIHENANTPQPTTATARVMGASILFLDAAGQPAASYLESTRVHVRVVDILASGPGVDVLSISLQAELSGDSETLDLVETSADSGVFEGSMNLALGGAVPFNNTLETTQVAGPPHEFDTLRASYFHDPASQLLEATATTEGSRIVFLDAFGRETSTFAAGSTAYLRVVDHNANQFGVFDTVEVAVVSLATGDFESLSLQEVGKNSAVFEGAIPLVSSATAQLSDGALQAEPGEVIEAEHVNALGLSTVRVQATLSFSQLLFVDTAGQPVAEIAEGGPARLRLIAPARNNDPGAVEVETVEVTSFYGGDVEPLTVEETGADTGVFEGTIQLSTSFSGTFDGQLFTVTNGSPLFLEDTVTASFVDAVATAKTVGSEVAFLDAFGRLTSTFAVGERVYLRVVDHNRNDDFQVDAFLLQVTSSSGDTETVEVTETSHDTAVFEGSIASSGVGLNPQDGQLQAAVGDDLVLIHENVNTPQPTTATARVMGASILFLDAAGQPAASYLESTRVHVRVVDILASGPGVDVLSVDLQAELSGDSESLQLTETAANSGVFEGSMNLALGGAVPFNNTLETTQAAGPPHEFDTLRASYFYDPASQLLEATARTEGSRIAFIDEIGQVTDTFTAGSTAYLRVEDHNANQPGVADTVEVAVVSLATGDFESFALQEVGTDSGVFEGSLALEDSVTAQIGDGALQAEPGEVIEAEHVNALGLSTVRVAARLSFAGLAFLGADHQPLPAPVRVLEAMPALLRLTLPSGNQDPGQMESLNVEVTSLYGGDVESVFVLETAADTGVFEGVVQLDSSFTGTFDGRLTTVNGGSPLFLPDTVTATFADAVATATTVGARAAFLNLRRDEVSTYARGSRIAVRVDDGNRNDPFQQDSLQVLVRSLGSGDEELVTLVEFGLASGRFEGSLPSQESPSGLGDGILQAVAGETVEVVHDHFNDPGQSTAQAGIGQNAVPVAVTDEVMTVSGVPVGIDVLANDSGEAPPLTSQLFTLAQSGAIGFEPDGTYTYTSNTGFVGTDGFTYLLIDAAGAESLGQVVVTVEPANQPPLAVDDAATTPEDQAVTVDVLANDTDPNDDPLVIAAVTQGTHGTVVIEPDETLTYTPAADFHGADSFTYTVRDPSDEESTATVTITVTAVNDAPVAADDAATTPEDQAVTVTVLGNDVDVDLDTLAVTAVTQGTNGTVVIELDETLTYTPAADFHGSDSFTYTVEDGAGGSDTATVTITVSPVNDAPVAADDSASTPEDQAVTVTVLANDVDVDLDTLAVTEVTQGTNGTVVIEPDETLTYTPAADFHGSDSFTYTVEDGAGGSDTATVTITVTAVNDAPVAVDDAATTPEDQAVTVTVLANDTDVDLDTLSVTAVTQGTNGTVVIEPDETVTYTPAADFHGADSFTYTVEDGAGGSDTATVTITVTPVNDAPVAADDAATTPEDQAVTITVLTNDVDVDLDTLSVTGVTQGTSGSVVINPDETVTYTPAANYFGADSFTYTVEDGAGGSDTATVTITVTAVNDAPVAVDDAATTTAGSAVIVSVLSNDADLDGPGLTVTAVTQGADGAVVVNGGTTVTFTPDAGFLGTDTFTYTVADGAGGSAMATVTVTVEAPPRVTTGLVVLYDFEEGSGTTVHDVSGVGTPLDLIIRSPGNASWQAGALSLNAATLISSSSAATKVINAVTATGEITVEAWIVPDNLTQDGPAAIVTMSKNNNNRNMTLGQEDNRFDARLRTTATNSNGQPPLLSPAGAVTLNLTHVVYTRTSAGLARLYVGGALVSTSTVGGNLGNWDSTNRLGLGRELNNRRHWLGELHLVSIYSRALSAAEVTQNHLAGAD